MSFYLNAVDELRRDGVRVLRCRLIGRVLRVGT
jgi:hypothetical protein